MAVSELGEEKLSCQPRYEGLCLLPRTILYMLYLILFLLPIEISNKKWDDAVDDLV